MPTFGGQPRRVALPRWKDLHLGLANGREILRNGQISVSLINFLNILKNSNGMRFKSILTMFLTYILMPVAVATQNSPRLYY